MGLEAVFFLGALVLLTALIYGVLSYRYRNRALDRVAEDVTRERYRRTKPSATQQVWSLRYRSALCRDLASSSA
jgi:hypothetical protein